MKAQYFCLLTMVLLLLMTTVRSQTIDTTAQVVTARDTAWKAGGLVTLTFAQSAFDNWSSGGENSYALNSRVNGYLNYQSEKYRFQKE